MIHFSNKGFLNWIIVVLFIGILYWFLGFHEALFYRPISIHQSAQASRASVALNFAEEGMNFFEPKVHGCKNTSGVTGLEFPMINYLAAICYKVFGFHDFWYRFIMLISITIGLIYGIKLSRLFVSNFWISFGLVIVWFLSPVLVYYSPNYNPDTASLGLTMISWYFAFSYFREKKLYQLVLWTVLIMIASLIKIVSLISVVVIVTLIVLDSIKWIRLELNLRQKLQWLLGVVLVLLAVYVWYKYARYLTDISGNRQFSLRMHAPKSLSYISDVWEKISWKWVPYYYSYPFYWFMLVSAVVCVPLYKRVSRILCIITLLMYLGAVSFFLMMMPQFVHHDYYIIALLPAVFFHLLMFFSAIQSLHIRYSVYLSVVLLAGIIFYSSGHAQKHQMSRYGGLYYSWEQDFSPYYSLEKSIRSLGITRDEKFIVFPDWTPSNSLYLINQKGWTVPSNKQFLLTALKDSKYALIADTSVIRHEKYATYFNNPIAVFPNNLVLFKISHDAQVFDSAYVYAALDSLCAPYKEIIQTSFESSDAISSGLHASKDLFRTGSQSIAVSKNQERYILATIPNEYYKIRVTAYVYGNPGNAKLSCSHKKTKFFMHHTPLALYDSLAWNKIELLYTKRFLPSRDSITIYMRNTAEQEVYFDDVTIELIR